MNEAPTPIRDTAAPGKTSLPVGAVVALVLLAFALGFGFNYGLSNQNTYLLAGLRLENPEYLKADWFASETTPYHSAFTFLTYAVLKLDTSGWVLALVNTLLILLGGLAVFAIVRCLVERAQVLPAFLIVVACAAATETFSAGESYLYWRVLQPSTLGATGFLASIYFYLRGRYVLSGLALAVGGVFHANYLVLAFPTFFLAHLALRRGPLGKRLVRQFAFPVLALLPLLPMLVRSAGPGGADALLVFLRIRSPHHYVPLHFWREFLPLVAWLALLAVALPRRDADPRHPTAGVSLLVSLLLLLGVATLLTTVVYVPKVAQLYVWRLAPVLVLLAQIYVARALVRSLAALPYDGLVRSPLIRGVVTLLAAALLVYHYERAGNALVPWLVIASLAAGSLGLAWKRWRPGRSRARRLFAGVLAGGVFVGAAGVGLADLEGRSNLLAPRNEKSNELYRWARSTPPTSRFLVPPDFEDFQHFRLATGRAIVADWKACPLLAPEVREWYARMTAVSGGVAPRSLEEARTRYAELKPHDFQAIAERYDVSYVVTRAEAPGQPPKGWPVVFETEAFSARRVP